jgi:hypothetical protein
VFDYLRFQQPTSAGFLPATNVEPPDGCHGKGTVLPPLDTPRRDIITVDTIETVQSRLIVSHPHGIDQLISHHSRPWSGQVWQSCDESFLFLRRCPRLAKETFQTWPIISD